MNADALVRRDPHAGPAPGAVRRVGASAGLLVGAMAGALVAARFETALACVAAAIAGAGAARAPRPSRTLIATLVTGTVLALAFNLWLVDGRALPWPTLAGRAATREGLAAGALLALRLVGAALAVHGLRAAWSGDEAADAVAGTLAPLQRIGVPVASWRAVLGLALRTAPLLREETRRIARLQDLRAGRAPRGLGERIERERAALVPALVGALERADRLALALEARHWRVRPLPPAPRVGAAGWAGALLALGSLAWRTR